MTESVESIDAAMSEAYHADAANGQLPTKINIPTMFVDQGAVNALHLLPPQNLSQREAKTGSTLFGVLNYGRTLMSKKLLREWIESPLIDLAAIERRQNYVDLFMTNSDLKNQFFEKTFTHLPDLDKIIGKFRSWQEKAAASTETKKKATLDVKVWLQALVEAYYTSKRLSVVITELQEVRGPYQTLVESEIIQPAQPILKDVQNYLDLIEKSVDLAAYRAHEFRLRPDDDEHLMVIDAKIKRNMNAMDAVVVEASDVLGLETKQIHLTNTPMHGWCLRVTRKDEKALRDHREYITLQTQKDGVYFTTQGLRTYNQARKDLEQQWVVVQQDALAELIDIACSHLTNFDFINRTITELDTLLGIAHASLHAPVAYVRPTMLPMGSGVLELHEARHPCVEATLSTGSFIPNDVNMQKETSRLQIITGPNMGGKSTYIRMVGILCIMAQIGSPLPVTSARMTIMEKVLARVGASDNTQEGMSTFMAEMVEAESIIKQATENSLVIIDELGRGTSTYDGFGLAYAISEELAQYIKCFTFFATHFAELPALASVLSCVKNLHVTALTDNNQITMLYQVKSGASDRSFGVHVAQISGFPSEVIRMARQKADELEHYSGNVELILENTASNPVMIEDEIKLSPDSQPNSTQSSPAHVRPGLASGKRVQPNSADLLPAADFVKDFLLSRPLSDFQTELGEPDMEKFRSFVEECKKKKAASTTTIKEESAPMEM